MDPISTLATLGNTLITKIWPDPKDQASAEALLIKTQMDAAIAQAQQQIDLTKSEAASSKPCVSGWRPFVGWACGVAFAAHFILLPLLNWLAQLFGHAPITIPFDMSTLSTVLMGLLGLGAMRSVEKVAGVASK